MLSLIYACGLRRSELLNLKPQDIDSKRHFTHYPQCQRAQRQSGSHIGPADRDAAEVL